MRVLVAGIGNLFLRDDAFGSEVVRRLDHDGLPEGVRAVDYGIRGLHLAYDLLEPWDALVIVDAVPARGEPGALEVLRVDPDDLGTGSLDAHGMDPGSVLASLGSLGGQLPRTLVVGCQVEEVGEGIGLSAPVAAAVQPGAELVLGLVRDLLAGRFDPASSVAREQVS